MPRFTAPQPHGEDFIVQLIKPFEGVTTQTIEIIGQPNRPATITRTNKSDANTSNVYRGEMSADDVNELLRLVDQIRGFPSDTKDIYGLDVKLESQSPQFSWSNAEEEPAQAATELEDETKQSFKNVVDSIEAAARQFAKQAAV